MQGRITACIASSFWNAPGRLISWWRRCSNELMSISAELLIIAGLILANGFFAAAEIAVLTARRNRLEQQARSQDRSAKKALDLALNPGRFLPTVQVGITLIATLTSAFGGATLARP